MNLLDIEELFYRSLGKSEEEMDKAIESDDIDEAIYAKYDCSFETYALIAEDLLNFTPVVETPLTGKQFHAFVNAGQQTMIVKKEVEK